ncbi:MULTISPECIES: hypothetical protein [Paracoccaceae]|jgi:hypothetical protein|uniref:hypothetical protein n=1 Tax=Rhodobacterales TaxID=204455 RepID=UPI001B24A854|nr:hypothetical protein [Boseongicola sp. H5]MBO6604860.1 hypothetical protein [Roseicyclus sp.]MBO6624493.1 hypothetical protein [Roseicyclus sp.]MBO6921220.1 hypothetical protein [Roseicyclus sp.]
MTRDDLDRALLAAHARDDRAALIGLYAKASDMATDRTARAFYLTQAYVFALEAGTPEAERLRGGLKALNAI